ncbi:hypothetical protein BH24ACI5_BH24ACI5_28170 [soil metagenome]
MDRRIDPILSAYRSAVDRQQAIVDRLRFASPPLLIFDAVTDIAGTTTARYRRFAAQLDEHHRAWRAYFYPLVHARVSLTWAHYEAAPRFVFVEESAAASARRQPSLIVCAAAPGILLIALVLWYVPRSPLTMPRG